MSFVTFVTNSRSVCMYKFTIVTIFVLRVMCFFSHPQCSLIQLLVATEWQTGAPLISAPLVIARRKTYSATNHATFRNHAYSAGHTNHALKTMFNT